MAREAVLVSYRLGGTDGVSVEAEKWEWALRVLGFTTRRIAGHICDEPRPDDVVLPGIAIDAPNVAADPGQFATALAGADLRAGLGFLRQQLATTPRRPAGYNFLSR